MATFHSSINVDNHGPRVVIVGAIMLAATVLMIAIAAYNRYHAKTMHHTDSPVLLVGAALDVLCFALIAAAVKQGFGRRVSMLDHTSLQHIEKLLLASVLVFFASHGIVKLSYNLLARRTGRSKRFKLGMDVLSVFIGLWTLANIIVIAIALRKIDFHQRAFFYVSGSLSIAIVLGQFFAFISLIWGTKAPLNVKIRWSVSMGAFVPLCITTIIVRMIYTPKNYFAGDWTFNDIIPAMLFQIELNMMTMTVLAPNLPIFFQKTSTGGVFFLPGDAMIHSRRATDPSTGDPTELSRVKWSVAHDGGVFDGKPTSTLTSTASRNEDTRQGRKKSFDSDVILMERTFDVDREPKEESPVLDDTDRAEP